MPFNDDIQEDISILEMRIAEDERRFDKLYESVGYLVLTVGELMRDWEHREKEKHG